MRMWDPRFWCPLTFFPFFSGRPRARVEANRLLSNIDMYAARKVQHDTTSATIQGNLRIFKLTLRFSFQSSEVKALKPSFAHSLQSDQNSEEAVLRGIVARPYQGMLRWGGGACLVGSREYRSGRLLMLMMLAPRSGFSGVLGCLNIRQVWQRTSYCSCIGSARGRQA